MSTNRPSWLQWILLHAVATAVVLLAPTALWWGEPVWSASPSTFAGLAGFCGVYALGAILGAVLFRHLEVRLAWLLVVHAAGLSLVYLALLVLDLEGYSRGLIVVASAVSLVVAVATFLALRSRSRFRIALAALPVLLIMLGFAPSGVRHRLAFDPGGHGRDLDAQLVRTADYPIRITVHDYQFTTDRRGGGLARLGNSVVLVTGIGEFYRLRWDRTTDALSVDKLGLRAPFDPEPFRRDAPSGVEITYFRTVGLLLQPVHDSLRVFVAHHVWHSDRRCFLLRLSLRTVAGEDALWSADNDGWSTLYDTTPCLPIRTNFGPMGNPFAGHQSGGRMVALQENEILLTVGDHEFDGWNSAEAYPQDPAADYGKTLRIGLDGSRHLYTLGHRNPQGLTMDTEGRLWLTEHGPQGGDELDVLVPGDNYGWPSHSYGTEYGEFSWPGGTDAVGFRTPAFVFNPSVGVSNLITLEGIRFARWQGHFLAATLKAERVFHIRIEDGRVLFTEPIPVDHRIRDIVEAADGRVVLWTDDDYAIVTLTPARPTQEGAAIFTRCVGCHRAGDDMAGSMAPDLWGVVGRRIASQSGYAYSTALRGMEGRWTEERLNAFLENPRAYAPGTTMAFEGLSDEKDRAAVIQYLRRFRR